MKYLLIMFAFFLVTATACGNKTATTKADDVAPPAAEEKAGSKEAPKEDAPKEEPKADETAKEAPKAEKAKEAPKAEKAKEKTK